ncbi:hypothetical protein MNBD_GAMMA01-1615 [hydrothermal vent metagenome]|uniref:Uncharacterized protein n=1 Tax=hydrothermal vent metagenome TaxID=652676 RepID=A0A3B0VH98_9ZZZZ
MGKQLAEPIPAFRSLVEVCKTNSTLEEPCLKISELFINKSKSIITVRVGYAMKIEILKQYGETKELKQAENDQSKYTSHYECLANIMNYGSSYMSHKGSKFSKIADPINRTFGEVAFLEKLAKLNYDYYSNLGNDNIKNPDSCSD